MRALLVYPRFPKTYWSYEKVLALVGRKALMPPLGLATVAALLPRHWEIEIVDRNVRPITEAEWSRADIVLLSAMIVQKEDLLAQIREAKSRGKTVVVGGPYPTSLPDEVEAAGADYLVLDEGELTIPAVFPAANLGLSILHLRPISRRFSPPWRRSRSSMAAAVRTITRAGMRVQAGFTVGFDGEAAGAGRRIVEFVEETAIPTAMVSMLQALPGTALWQRLQSEGRLLEGHGDGNQTSLMNFLPTRPLDEIAREYVEAFWELYDPIRYLDRVHRYFLALGAPRRLGARRLWAMLNDVRVNVTALARVVWRQGARRRTRWRFWHHLASMAARNPGVLVHYLAVCAHNEHYLEYREIIRGALHPGLAGVRAAGRDTAGRVTARCAPGTRPAAR
jgi:radical SAM superfamily enzyme YgiQ (UPF0313 family)